MSAVRKTPARVGRPLLLNAHAQENIVRALKAGSHLKHAVEGFGVSYATAARWMADGQAHAEGTASTAQRTNLGSSADAVAGPPCVGMDDLEEDGSVRRVCQSSVHPFREFREAVVRARAEAVLTIVGRISEAARSGNVTAQLALLRALAPEEWGEHRKLRIESGGGSGGRGTAAHHLRREQRPRPKGARRDHGVARGGRLVPTVFLRHHYRNAPRATPWRLGHRKPTL